MPEGRPKKKQKLAVQSSSSSPFAQQQQQQQQARAAPLQAWAAPLQSSAAPLQSSAAPLQSSAAPLQSSAAPLQSSAQPLSFAAQSSAAPGQSSVAPFAQQQQQAWAAPLKSLSSPLAQQQSSFLANPDEVIELADSMAAEIIQEMMPIVDFKCPPIEPDKNTIAHIPKNETTWNDDMLVKLKFMYDVSELIDGGHDFTRLNPNAFDILKLKDYYNGKIDILKDLVEECKIFDNTSEEGELKLSFLSPDGRFKVLRGHEIMSSMTLKVMELYSTMGKGLGIDWVNIIIGDRDGNNREEIHFGGEKREEVKKIFTKAITSLNTKAIPSLNKKIKKKVVTSAIKSTSEAGRKADDGNGSLTQTVLAFVSSSGVNNAAIFNAFSEGEKMKNSSSLLNCLDRGPGKPSISLSEWCSSNTTLEQRQVLFNSTIPGTSNICRDFTLFITDEIIIKAHVYLIPPDSSYSSDYKLGIVMAIYENRENPEYKSSSKDSAAAQPSTQTPRGTPGEVPIYYINVKLLSDRGISVDAIICEVRNIMEDWDTMEDWGEYRGDELKSQDDFEVVDVKVHGNRNIAIMLLRYLKTLGDHVWGVALGEGDDLGKSSFCQGQLLCTTCDTWLKHVQFHKYSLGYIYSAEMFIESISKGGNWRIRSLPITDNNSIYIIKQALTIACGFMMYDPNFKTDQKMFDQKMLILKTLIRRENWVNFRYQSEKVRDYLKRIDDKIEKLESESLIHNDDNIEFLKNDDTVNLDVFEEILKKKLLYKSLKSSDNKFLEQLEAVEFFFVELSNLSFLPDYVNASSSSFSSSSSSSSSAASDKELIKGGILTRAYGIIKLYKKHFSFPICEVLLEDGGSFNDAKYPGVLATEFSSELRSSPYDNVSYRDYDEDGTVTTVDLDTIIYRQLKEGSKQLSNDPILQTAFNNLWLECKEKFPIPEIGGGAYSLIKAYSVFKRLIFMKPNDGLREGLLEMKENNQGFEWIAKRRGKIFLKYKLYKILSNDKIEKHDDIEDEINKNIVNAWLDALNISLDNIDKTVTQREVFQAQVISKENEMKEKEDELKRQLVTTGNEVSEKEKKLLATQSKRKMDAIHKEITDLTEQIITLKRNLEQLPSDHYASVNQRKREIKCKMIKEYDKLNCSINDGAASLCQSIKSCEDTGQDADMVVEEFNWGGKRKIKKHRKTKKQRKKKKKTRYKKLKLKKKKRKTKQKRRRRKYTRHRKKTKRSKTYHKKRRRRKKRRNKSL